MGIDRRGKSWRARVTLPDRSQRSRSFRTRAEAVRWEAEQKTALARGNYVDTSSKVTMADYAREWAAMRPHRPSTMRNTSIFIEKHLAPPVSVAAGSPPSGPPRYRRGLLSVPRSSVP